MKEGGELQFRFFSQNQSMNNTWCESAFNMRQGSHPSIFRVARCRSCTRRRSPWRRLSRRLWRCARPVPTFRTCPFEQMFTEDIDQVFSNSRAPPPPGYDSTGAPNRSTPFMCCPDSDYLDSIHPWGGGRAGGVEVSPGPNRVPMRVPPPSPTAPPHSWCSSPGFDRKLENRKVVGGGVVLRPPLIHRGGVGPPHLPFLFLNRKLLQKVKKPPQNRRFAPCQKNSYYANRIVLFLINHSIIYSFHFNFNSIILCLFKCICALD